MPRVVPEIVAENGFRLRRWELTDRGLLREVATDPYIPLITTVPAPYSEEGADAFVRRQWMRTEIGTGYPFVIEAPTVRPSATLGCGSANCRCAGLPRPATGWPEALAAGASHWPD